jgi:hypothetical protein
MPKQAKRSLLQGLLARFSSRKEPPAVSGPLRPFQAISIYRGLICCDMARKFSDHRFLVRDAPPLPLAGCSLAKQVHQASGPARRAATPDRFRRGATLVRR